MCTDPAAELMARLREGIGADLLRTLPPYEESQSLALTTRLRQQGHDPELVAAALTQSRLRARARPRMGPLADRLLLTQDGLEQATRPAVSRRRAERFLAAGVRHVTDLGCGLGLDALAMSQAGLEVVAVERDPVVAEAARANLAGFPSARVVLGEVDQVMPSRLDGAFVDPARRTPGIADVTGRTRRQFRLQDLSPSWDVVQQVAARSRVSAAKLAPGFPHREIPAGALAEWVSLDDDLLECTLWWGLSADVHPAVGDAARCAAVGRSTPEGVRWHELVPSGPPPPPLQDEAGLGPWLAEPDAALLAGGLVGALADLVDGAEVGLGSGYVSAPARTELALARWYAVREVLPLHARAVRGWLRERGIGRVTLKKRGVPTDPEAFRRELRLPRRSDGNSVTLVLTTVAGTPRALVVDPAPAR